MKRLLILPILSLLSATAFCTGLFSQTDDTANDILDPANELVYMMIDSDNPIEDEAIEVPVIDPDETEEILEGLLPFISDQGEVIFTKRSDLFAGTSDDPLTTSDSDTTEAPQTDAPQTDAPTTDAPATEPPETTTEAPTVTQAPVTTPPVTTTAPATTPSVTVSPETEAPVTPSVTPSTSSQAEKIVQIAKGEIGVKETSSNNVKYNTWYFGHAVSGGDSYAWCGVFVAWCGDQAGISQSILPVYRSSTQYKEFYEAKGLYYKYSSGYTPKPGDLIFFDWSGRRSNIAHIGIVVACEGGYITTVEGNYSNKVSCNTYALNNKNIVGYAAPAYQ